MSTSTLHKDDHNEAFLPDRVLCIYIERGPNDVNSEP